MFGKQPRLPVDLALGIGDNAKEDKPYSAYAEDLKARLTHAYDLASREMQKRALANKTRYDLRSRDAALQVGDRVLVRNLSIRGKQKLADRWEDTTYLVTRKIPDLPVYAVRPERGGKERVLHRNLLLPFNVIPQFQDKRPPAPGDTREPQEPAHPTDPEERMALSPDHLEKADSDVMEEGDLADVVLLRPDAPEFRPPITPPVMDQPIVEPPTPPPDVPEADVLETIAPPETNHVPQDPEPIESEDALGTDGEPAVDPETTSRPVVTRAGRESRPPKWFHEEQFVPRARLLLSLADVENQSLIENVFRTWLST